VLEAVILLAEVPSGSLADWWGRSRTVGVSMAAGAFSWLVFGWSRGFAAFCLSQALLGLSDACHSGAKEAWVAQALAGRPELRLERALATGRSLFLACLVAAGLGAGYLAADGGAAPFFCAAALHLLAMAVVFGLGRDARTPRRHPSGITGGLRETVTQARAGFRFLAGHRIIALLFLATCLGGFAGDAVERYWQVDLAVRGLAPATFGPLVAGTTLASLAALNLAARSRRPLAVLGLLALVDTACLAVLTTGGLAGGLAATMLFLGMRGAAYPVYMGYLNARIRDEIRATVLSVDSLMNSAGEVAAGLVLGGVAAVAGLGGAFALAAAVAGAAALIYVRLLLSDRAGRKTGGGIIAGTGTETGAVPDPGPPKGTTPAG